MHLMSSYTNELTVRRRFAAFFFLLSLLLLLVSTRG